MGRVTNSDNLERSPQWKHLLKSVKKDEKQKYKKKIKEEYKNAPELGNITLKMIRGTESCYKDPYYADWLDRWTNPEFKERLDAAYLERLEAYRKKHPNQPRKFHIEEQNQIINKEKDE
jgi:hypothetical protein|tara:strand:- start:848 stop:1204 length:357 start_codon:yes stop_codon:yes gene_type:complete